MKKKLKILHVIISDEESHDRGSLVVMFMENGIITKTFATPCINAIYYNDVFCNYFFSGICSN